MQRSRKHDPRGRPSRGSSDFKGYAKASFGLVALALVVLICADFARPDSQAKSPAEAHPSSLTDSLPKAPAAVQVESGGAVASQPESVPEPQPPAAEEAMAPNPVALQEAARKLSSRTQGGQEAVYKRQMPSLAPVRKGTMVIVIDDVGNNLVQLEPFLRLPFPLTFAVLPGLLHSQEAARRILAAGKELILHQPMEALGGQDPGPGAISLAMTPDEAKAIVRANLDSLPGAVGMNNHEGSAVTRNEGLMAAIVGVAKKRGIYYLDSLTIPETATPVVAARAGIRYWERDVFLDNSPDRVSIVHYIDVGKKKAEKTGSAIMIGHIWSAELAQTLSELYPQLVAEGFSLSTISRVMLEEADAGPGD